MHCQLLVEVRFPLTTTKIPRSAFDIQVNVDGSLGYVSEPFDSFTQQVIPDPEVHQTGATPTLEIRLYGEVTGILDRDPRHDLE